MSSTNDSVLDALTNDRRTASLAIASVYTVAIAALFWAYPGLPTVARIPLSLPLLLFVPGYAVLAAVLPSTAGGTNSQQTGSETGITTVERCVLAVLASIAIVPMVAAVANAVVGIETGPVLFGLCIVTVIASSVGVLRHERGSPSTTTGGGGSAFGVLSGVTTGLTPVALVAVLLLLASSGFLLATDDGAGQPMTEFYLANASGPDDTTDGVYHLRLKQHSEEPQEYTVVVVRAPAGSTETQTGTELDRFRVGVEPGTTEKRSYRVASSELAPNSELRFLLYRDASSPDPTADAPDRRLRVFVDGTAER